MAQINKLKVFSLLFLIMLSSCKRTDDNKEMDSINNRTSHHDVAKEVLEASKKWIQSFNKKDFEFIKTGYDKNAILKQGELPAIKGNDSISKYWFDFINNAGASMLSYHNIKIEVENDSLVYLSADWTMNVAQGFIYREAWIKKEKKWLLNYDGFVIDEIYKIKKNNPNANPFLSHNLILESIEESQKWIFNFNNKKYHENALAYSKDAVMNMNSLGVKYGQDEIRGFWKSLIDDNVTNLVYYKPSFEEKNKKILIQSKWSMNKYKGEITLEKWIKNNNKWLLIYDEFNVQ